MSEPAVKKRATECFICKEPAKYTCPACGITTCSVTCSKEHKRLSSCTGELDPARRVSREELLTATGLDRDYNYLQRMGRSIHVEKAAPAPKPRAIVRNGCQVQSLPREMTRAKQNKSRWDKVKKVFVWTVEIVNDDGKSQLSQVPDTTPIRTLGSNLALKNASGKFKRLNADETLAESLRGQSVLEFPTLVEKAELSETDSASDSASDTSSDSDSDSDSDSNGEPQEESAKPVSEEDAAA